MTTVFVVCLDQVSKHWAQSLGRSWLNTGISFGWFDSLPSLPMMVLTGGMWLGIAYYLVKSPHLHSVGRGLVIGGGLSNVSDRLLWGGVRDWIPVPGLNVTNNLADYALVIGCLTIVVTQYLSMLSKPRNTNET